MKVKDFLFRFVELAAMLVFVFAFTVYCFWVNGEIPHGPGVVAAHQLILASSPVIVGSMLIRWITKWPVPVSWFTIAFGLTALTVFVIALRALLYLYSDDNSDLLMKVVLPALVPIISILAAAAAIKWFKDRERQRAVS